MANVRNLIPQAHKLTVEEQSRGGRISGIKRRERKEYKDLLEEILTEDIADDKLLDFARNFGIENPDTKILTLLGIVRAAINGDVKAFNILYELTGEKSEDANSDIISKLDEVLKGIDDIALMDCGEL